MHRYVLHNRAIRDARDPLLAPGQVGFLNGWGVFSTLLVARGVLFAFERHYNRLQRDAELLHVPFVITPDELQNALLTLVEANSALDAVLRVAIVRNRGGLYEAPDLTRDFELLAFTADLKQWGSGVDLTYLPNGRFAASPFAGTKITSWAQNLTWNEIAREQGFDECILLNEVGQVSECTSANVFVVQGKKVWTPPLNTSGCLPGVTRAILLEEISIEGIEIGVRDLSPSELEDSDVVFITSTTRDLLPVLSIDRYRLKQDLSVFSRLRSAFRAHRDAYIQSAVRPTLVNS